jgi:hypothetical protein
LAAAAVMKYVTPAFGGVGRPFLKGIIKTSLSTFEMGRKKFAQASEVVEDLIAEARAELAAETGETAAGPQPSAATPPPRTNGGA